MGIDRKQQNQQRVHKILKVTALTSRKRWLMIKKNAEKGEDFPAQRMKEKRGAGFNEAIMESVPGSMAVDTGKCDGRSLTGTFAGSGGSGRENTGPVPIYQTKRISAFGRTDPSGRHRKGHSEREERDRCPLDFLEAVHCDGG